MREIEAETHEEETSTIIQAVPVTPTPVEGIPEPMNIEDEAAMAWLESLASKQGVPEEQLTTRPEERPETPPEWVLETGGKSEQPAEPAAEVVPDWLKQA